MRIHRTEHARQFTVLPNAVLQYRQLSYTARGLLADLLSRPDGWRENGRHMADTSPQGRGAVSKALKELTAAGFYRVEVVRLPDGTLRSEAHVYDTPQLWTGSPGTTRPVSGEPVAGPAGAPEVKNREKQPSLPTDQQSAKPVTTKLVTAHAKRETGGQQGPQGAIEPPPTAPDERTRAATATLLRVISPEPRLHLGHSEAEALAPLVAQWLDRGSTATRLAQALLPGLPEPVHSAPAVLRYRLKHKMPPPEPPTRPAAPRYAECADCHDPVPRPGLCRACAGPGKHVVAAGPPAPVTAAGAEQARSALRTARGTLPTSPHTPAAPAPSSSPAPAPTPTRRANNG
ncbi:hypothetical protein [Kitasatospora sp. NPDC097643]|uniref:hypothetical protein n=1 Tax=Kitasatospora sp. NPDC097643 TaxID=3157230 RepID=UPI0033196BCA